MGGAGAGIRVGQPHGAVDRDGVELPGSPTASTELWIFSGRRMLSLIIPSYCKHILLMNILEN